MCMLSYEQIYSTYVISKLFVSFSDALGFFSHLSVNDFNCVWGGIVHMCMWVHVCICMHAEASEEQWTLIFLCLCQFYCFETDLSLNLRLIISARRARQFSGFVYLGSPPTPCTGVKGTHGQAQLLCGYWGIQSQVAYIERTLTH